MTSSRVPARFPVRYAKRVFLTLSTADLIAASASIAIGNPRVDLSNIPSVISHLLFRLAQHVNRHDSPPLNGLIRVFLLNQPALGLATREGWH